MGRIVAQPMSHVGAPWLIRPERNDEENATEAFDQLGIEPGMTLVDLGCGNGFWTLPMAKACKLADASESGKSGKKAPEKTDSANSETDAYAGEVLAVDIQREMLQKLRRNMLRAKVDNVVPILGAVDNPNLPTNEVDLVLLVDVYHEFSHPESMLWEIRNSLKPEGVIALLEYRTEDPNVPIKPLHKMSKSQIMKEYAASHLKLVREYNELPWQHLMFFARDDSPLPEIQPSKFTPPVE
jgi:ubiquinone/menaquinone biosynthesis C-methylase UbiE